MFKLIRKIAYKSPEWKVDEECLDEFGRVGTATILDNIRNQQQADGTALKRNATSTTKRKRDLGLPNPELSLVWIGRRLVKGKEQSFVYQVDIRRRVAVVRPSEVERTASHKGVGSSTASPAQLSQWVQEQGYLGWLGISEKGRQALRHALRKFLQRTINKVRKGQNG